MHKNLFFDRVLGYILLDSDFYVVEVNEAFSKMTGYQKEEVEGTSLNMLFDSFTADKIFSIHDSFGCKSIQQTISGELRKKDGPPVPAQIKINCTGSSSNWQYWLLIMEEEEIKKKKNSRKGQQLLSS